MDNDSTFDDMSDDAPLITKGDFKGLRGDWERAVEALEKAKKEIAELDAKFKAIEVIWPQAAFDRSSAIGSHTIYPQGSIPLKKSITPKKSGKPSKVAIIESILLDYPYGVSGAAVHRDLEKRGIPTHMNYVYKVLSNLRDKGKAIQAHDKTYRHKEHQNSDLVKPTKKDLFGSRGADA